MLPWLFNRVCVHYYRAGCNVQMLRPAVKCGVIFVTMTWISELVAVASGRKKAGLSVPYFVWCVFTTTVFWQRSRRHQGQTPLTPSCPLVQLSESMKRTSIVKPHGSLISKYFMENKRIWSSFNEAGLKGLTQRIEWNRWFKGWLFFAPSSLWYFPNPQWGGSATAWRD